MHAVVISFGIPRSYISKYIYLSAVVGSRSGLAVGLAIQNLVVTIPGPISKLHTSQPTKTIAQKANSRNHEADSFYIGPAGHYCGSPEGRR
jgi:hypothetical protein